jgi:hypothetical protein
METMEVEGRKVQIPEYHTLWRLIYFMQNNINALAGRGAGGPVLGGPLNMGNVVKGSNSEEPSDEEFLTLGKAKEYFAPEVMAKQLGVSGEAPLSIEGLKGLAAQAQTPMVDAYDPNQVGYYDKNTLVTVNGELALVQQGSPQQYAVPAMAVPATTSTQAASADFGQILPSQALEVSINWDSPFVDSNYIPVGSILESSSVGAGLVFERFRSISASGVVGVVWNGGGIPLSGTLYAMAFHP